MPGRDCPGRQLPVAEQQRIDQLLPIDGHGERPANALIVQQWLLSIPANVVILARRIGDQTRAGGALDLLSLMRLQRTVHVDVPAQRLREQRRGFGDEPEYHTRELGRSTEGLGEIGVSLERDALPRFPGHEPERPATDGATVEWGTRHLRRRHVLQEVAGYRGPPETIQWPCVRSAEIESDRKRVDDLNRLDLLQIDGSQNRRGLRVLGSVESELDVVRGDAVTVVPVHVALQVEGDAIRGEIPGRCQIRARLEGGIVLNQRGEQHVVIHLGRVEVCIHQWIERLHLGAQSHDGRAAAGWIVSPPPRTRRRPSFAGEAGECSERASDAA